MRIWRTNVKQKTANGKKVWTSTKGISNNGGLHNFNNYCCRVSDMTILCTSIIHTTPILRCSCVRFLAILNGSMKTVSTIVRGPPEVRRTILWPFVQANREVEKRKVLLFFWLKSVFLIDVQQYLSHQNPIENYYWKSTSGLSGPLIGEYANRGDAELLRKS